MCVYIGWNLKIALNTSFKIKAATLGNKELARATSIKSRHSLVESEQG